jgi:hypothetical protein
LVVLAGHLLYPYLHNVLVPIAYGLVLPALAQLHVRMRVRESGKILGTLAGLGAALVGLAAATDADLRPAALLLLGMWWWTVGKMAAETGFLPRRFGLATALLALVALLAMPLEAGGAPLTAKLPGFPDLPVWSASRVVLAVWLLALAALLARERSSASLA